MQGGDSECGYSVTFCKDCRRQAVMRGVCCATCQRACLYSCGCWINRTSLNCGMHQSTQARWRQTGPCALSPSGEFRCAGDTANRTVRWKVPQQTALGVANCTCL
eukprot:5649388-Amphidinium_carterae.1